jgi:hypothetical protein
MKKIIKSIDSLVHLLDKELEELKARLKKHLDFTGRPREERQHRSAVMNNLRVIHQAKSVLLNSKSNLEFLEFTDEP